MVNVVHTHSMTYSSMHYSLAHKLCGTLHLRKLYLHQLVHIPKIHGNSILDNTHSVSLVLVSLVYSAAHNIDH